MKAVGSCQQNHYSDSDGGKVLLELNVAIDGKEALELLRDHQLKKFAVAF